MIYAINKQRLAEDRVIPFLHQLHRDATQWKDRLLDASRTLNVYRILQKRNNYNATRTDLNTFKAANGTWFDGTYPDYADPLTGAIASLGNIIIHIDTLVAASYTDAETGEPILMDVTQGDRNTLAADIGDELQ